MKYDAGRNLNKHSERWKLITRETEKIDVERSRERQSAQIKIRNENLVKKTKTLQTKNDKFSEIKH